MHALPGWSFTLFALALAIPLSGQPLRITELVGVLILGGGVAALSLAGAATSPAESFGSSSGWFAAAAIAVVAGTRVRPSSGPVVAGWAARVPGAGHPCGAARRP